MQIRIDAEARRLIELRRLVREFIKAMRPTPGLRGREKMWDCPACGCTTRKDQCENKDCFVVRLREMCH